MKILFALAGLASLLSLSGCYVTPAPVYAAPPPPPPAAYGYGPGPYYTPGPAYYPAPAYYGAPVSVGIGFGGGGYWRHR